MLIANPDFNSKIPYAYRNPMMRNNPVRGVAISRRHNINATARNWTPYEKYTPYWWNSRYGSVTK